MSASTTTAARHTRTDVDQHLAAVVQAADADDVVATVRCARSHGYSLAVSSGATVRCCRRAPRKSSPRSADRTNPHHPRAQTPATWPTARGPS